MGGPDSGAYLCVDPPNTPPHTPTDSQLTRLPRPPCVDSRLNDLQNTKHKLAEADTERQRLLRDQQELEAKLQWLTRINQQVGVG